MDIMCNENNVYSIDLLVYILLFQLCLKSFYLLPVKGYCKWKHSAKYCLPIKAIIDVLGEHIY